MADAPHHPQVVDVETMSWSPMRFEGVGMKKVLSRADTEPASVCVVQIEPQKELGLHVHPESTEYMYVKSGEVVLVCGEERRTLCAGQFGTVPPGLNHALRNDAGERAEVIAFFIPPIF